MRAFSAAQAAVKVLKRHIEKARRDGFSETEIRSETVAYLEQVEAETVEIARVSNPHAGRDARRMTDLIIAELFPGAN